LAAPSRRGPLPDAVEEEAWAGIKQIDALGGSVKAIEERYAARDRGGRLPLPARGGEGERIIVGVNRYETDDDPEMDSADETIQEQ